MQNNSQIRLQLQDDVLILTAWEPTGECQSFSGSIAGVRRVLGSSNLTEQKLEEGITRTEDVIMPMMRSLSRGATLSALGSELMDVFRLLPSENSATVSVASVELLFNALADHASGSPVAWRQPLPAQQVALGLVVLREVMHHGGFVSVSLLPQTE